MTEPTQVQPKPDPAHPMPDEQANDPLLGKVAIRKRTLITLVALLVVVLPFAALGGIACAVMAYQAIQGSKK